MGVLCRRRRWSRQRQSLAWLAVLVAALVTGCSGADGQQPAESEPVPIKGGTVYLLLDDSSGWDLDPLGLHNKETQAFLGAFLHRTLLTYTTAPDPAQQLMLTPDLATDTGSVDPSGTTWSFTLREDAVWEDGAPVTCADVKYGVSRRFADDVFSSSPRRAIDLLDIPVEADGRTSRYKGPYSGRGEDLFDAAVTCEGPRITFRLREPTADFDEILTLPAFSPVREDRDTGDNYGDGPLSSGPYRVLEASGLQTVLVRNENWDAVSDPTRPAFPDRLVVVSGLEPNEIASRLVADSGDDKYALSTDIIDGDLSRVFDDPGLQTRRWNQPDLGVEYVAINTELVPQVSHRRAIAAAFDRQSYLDAFGGIYQGAEVDGVVSPALALDYAETGMWSGLIGQPIGPGGDPDAASEVIQESEAAMPVLRFDYPDTPTHAKAVAAFVLSMEAAGIRVEPNPIGASAYYSAVVDPEDAGHLTWVSWSPDWPNASTVLAPLYAGDGGFNLSRINQVGGVQDDELSSLIGRALVETSRRDQGELWKQVNTKASELALAVPAAATRQQRAWGSGLAGVRFFAPGTFLR